MPTRSDIRACFNASIHWLILFNVAFGAIRNVVSAMPTRTDMRLQECVFTCHYFYALPLDLISIYLPYLLCLLE